MIFLLPGISNSGPAHWQSVWQRIHPHVIRIEQRDWDHPVCDEWVEELDRAVSGAATPPVLVAHSLGCLAVVHWASASSRPIKGALLVAPPDPTGSAFPQEAVGFAPLPQKISGRHLKIISSSDDPYSSEEFVSEYAGRWNASHTCVGTCGHLNAASGLGDWPAGWSMVKQILAV